MDPNEKDDDLVDIGGDDPIVFTDNSDGSPKTQEEVDAEYAERLAAGPVKVASEDEPPPKEVIEAEKDKPEKRKKDPRRRINELVRERGEAQERAAAAETAAELLTAQLNELKAKSGTKESGTLEEREAAVRARMKEAVANVDFEAYDDAREDLDQIRDLRRAPKAEPEPRKAAPAADAPLTFNMEKMAPVAKEWVTRNEWMTQGENVALAKAALQIEARLQREGVPFGPDLYRRLDEELADLEEFDAVLPRSNGSHEQPSAARTERSRQIVAAPSRGAGPPPESATSRHDLNRQFSAEEKGFMRKWNLNPDDPVARKTYLKYRSQ